MWYIATNGVLAALVLIDGSKRMVKSPPIWALATFLVGPLAVPFYLSRRYLLADESRRGGNIWNVMKNFSLFWTVFMLLIAISELFWLNNQDAIMQTILHWAGLNLTSMVGLRAHAIIWLAPVLIAMTVGAIFRRSARVEVGPTGPLAWWTKLDSSPRTVVHGSLG